MTLTCRQLALTLGVLCLAAGASAQTGLSGSIAGVVKDTSGAVLPGVTVEASSPALIEKVRTVVTDERGQYKIVDLRPGTYAVTFSLAGFTAVRREGIVLTTGFTAPANADLAIGSIQETVTVTGATPVVDVQGVRGQNVLTRETLDEIPTAKTYSSFAALTVGASGVAREVGGNKGESNSPLVIHGAGGGLSSVDGMRVTVTHLSGTPRIYQFNQLAAQEIVLETNAVSAEGENGSLNVNLVPRDGSNIFSGLTAADYTNRSMQNDNISAELTKRGLINSPKTRKIWDYGGGLGGPLKKDTLWFFGAYRNWGSSSEFAGSYFNATQNTLFFTPDLSRPGYQDSTQHDSTARLKWQITTKQRLAIMGSLQNYCRCYYRLSGTVAPEASNILRFTPNDQKQITWTYALTSRLLIDAGAAHRNERQISYLPPETSKTDRSVRELSTGLLYGSQFGGPADATWLNEIGDHRNAPNASTRFAVAYVPGSHAFKFGVTTYAGRKGLGGEPNFPEQYTFNNRVPVSITQLAAPNYGESRIRINLGIYAQDQWTLKNLTLNLGGRFDYFNGYNPAQTRPAGKYTPELRFEEVDNLPNWKDFSPRLGAAYDLFGNGKTALKVTLNRYVGAEAMVLAFAHQPGLAISSVTTRTWNDSFFPAGDPRRGNYLPDCDLFSTLANSECGAMSDQNFGKIGVTTRYDPKLLAGLRPFVWQTSAIVQHELRPGFGMTAGYYRTWNGNFRVTDNLSVAPADFDQFCLTAPKDPRLPGGGGNQLCGLADIKPAAFGLTSNLVAPAKNYGKRSQIYNGVEVTLNARFGHGGLLQGGFGTARTVTDNCSIVDSPATLFCKVTNPWLGSTQLKLSGIYPLPWGLQASAVFLNLPGAVVSGTYVATNAEIAPSLGRNLGQCRGAATCNGTATVTIIEPSSVRERRDAQVDLRFSKNVRSGRLRVQPRLDIYNLFNANSVLASNGRFGPSWLTPTDVLPGRMFKVGAQLDF